jgi:hypothetical protein
MCRHELRACTTGLASRHETPSFHFSHLKSNTTGTEEFANFKENYKSDHLSHNVVSMSEECSRCSISAIAFCGFELEPLPRVSLVQLPLLSFQQVAANASMQFVYVYITSLRHSLENSIYTAPAEIIFFRR